MNDLEIWIYVMALIVFFLHLSDREKVRFSLVFAEPFLNVVKKISIYVLYLPVFSSLYSLYVCVCGISKWQVVLEHSACVWSIYWSKVHLSLIIWRRLECLFMSFQRTIIFRWHKDKCQNLRLSIVLHGFHYCCCIHCCCCWQWL